MKCTAWASRSCWASSRCSSRRRPPGPSGGARSPSACGSGTPRRRRCGWSRGGSASGRRSTARSMWRIPGGLGFDPANQRCIVETTERGLSLLPVRVGKGLAGVEGFDVIAGPPRNSHAMCARMVGVPTPDGGAVEAGVVRLARRAVEFFRWGHVRCSAHLFVFQVARRDAGY